jgi:lipopolysaccharide transport system permease protein
MSLYVNLARQIAANWRFIYETTRRDLSAKNKGAVLGAAWLAIVPLIQSATYILFVSIILNRGGVGTSSFSYAVYMLCGLLPWTTMTRVFVESPTLLLERSSLLKQIVYPIETLPFTTIVSALLAMGLTFIVLIVFSLIDGQLSWTVLFLPVILILLLLFSIGAAWCLMVVGAVLKDLREITNVAMALLMFISPVMLTEQMVGPRIWSYLMLNPFGHVVIAFRDVMFGTFNVWSWVILLLLTAASILLGGWLVTKAKVMINEYI